MLPTKSNYEFPWPRAIQNNTHAPTKVDWSYHVVKTRGLAYLLRTNLNSDRCCTGLKAGTVVMEIGTGIHIL